MQHPSDNLERNWRGFRPTPYTLDQEKVHSLPLIRVDVTPAGQREETPTTLGEVLASLAGQEPANIDNSTDWLAVGTAASEMVLLGPPFSRNVARNLLELRKDGIDGIGAEWFWYLEEVVSHNPESVEPAKEIRTWEGMGFRRSTIPVPLGEAAWAVCDDDNEPGRPYRSWIEYTFFVVHDNRIVRERMAFTYSPNSGFDPSVFQEVYEPYDEARMRFEAHREALGPHTPFERLRGWTERLWDPTSAALREIDTLLDLSEGPWVHAGVRFWYRKFYQDSQAGQIMVLDSDKPLYYYPEGRRTPDWQSALVPARLRGIRLILWLLVGLALVAVVLLWR